MHERTVRHRQDYLRGSRRCQRWTSSCSPSTIRSDVERQRLRRVMSCANSSWVGCVPATAYALALLDEQFACAANTKVSSTRWEIGFRINGVTQLKSASSLPDTGRSRPSASGRLMPSTASARAGN